MRARFLWFLPAVAWCAVIVAFSSQPADVSDGNSRGLLVGAFALIERVTGLAPLAPDMPGYEDRLYVAEGVFREAMHFVEYAVLGVLSGLAVKRGLPGRMASDRRSVDRALLWAFAACVVFAVADEAHQLLVPGRDFQLLDLSLDALGSAAGLWVARGRASRDRMAENVPGRDGTA